MTSNGCVSENKFLLSGQFYSKYVYDISTPFIHPCSFGDTSTKLCRQNTLHSRRHCSIYNNRYLFTFCAAVHQFSSRRRNIYPKMSVNAQHLITLSIGKITGSRNQRGGVCLRKNLLVASVLTTARAYYYEEMCNNMQEHSTDIEDDYDNSRPASTPSEWDKEELNESCEQSNIVMVATPCVAPQELESCGRCNVIGTADKENDQPTPSLELTVLKSVEMASCEPTTETENSSQRSVLSDCTSIEHNTEKCCKRKRSEVEEACESITPKKARRTDHDSALLSKSSITIEQVAVKTEGSSISSLVNIFRSGLQGLSGDIKSQSTSNSHYSLPRTAFAQAPISIAAC